MDQFGGTKLTGIFNGDIIRIHCNDLHCDIVNDCLLGQPALFPVIVGPEIIYRIY